MGSHHRGHKGKTNEWLTPPHILEALGEFDLDPCSPANRPWPTAHCHYTIQDQGLELPWAGRIWLNPPYGPETAKWLKRLSQHRNGIALVFARTETKMFFKWGWDKADAMLFLKGRLHFHRIDGTRAKANAGAPSVLIAYGRQNVQSLIDSRLPGKLVTLKPRP